MMVDRKTVSVNPHLSLENRIVARMGVLPNFFRLGATDPTIAANFWAFAEFGYMDNPLPSLFKERLFVYLSRFCDIRYCIARHLGFLIGLAILPAIRRASPKPSKRSCRFFGASFHMAKQ